MKRSRSRRQSGVDPSTFVDVMTSSLFDAPVFKTYGA
jgi:hypothetical protein